MREPGACDEATGVPGGASHGGVAATRGVEARPDDEDVMLLRAESRRSASASARSRIAVGSLFFGVVGVCGSARKKLKQWVSSVALAIVMSYVSVVGGRVQRCMLSAVGLGVVGGRVQRCMLSAVGLGGSGCSTE